MSGAQRGELSASERRLLQMIAAGELLHSLAPVTPCDTLLHPVTPEL